jgi:hypothetical protein
MTLRKIIIEFTNDPSEIRNSGLGDYYYVTGGDLIVKTYMKDADSYNEAWLIAMHELIEQRLTEHAGIEESDIDKFDRMIDENGGQADEAGNEPNSPYRLQHRFAENIERMLAHELKVDWFNYYNNYQI